MSCSICAGAGACTVCKLCATTDEVMFTGSLGGTSCPELAGRSCCRTCPCLGNALTHGRSLPSATHAASQVAAAASCPWARSGSQDNEHISSLGLLALDQLLHQLLLFVGVSGLLCLQSCPQCHQQQPT